MSLTHSKTTVTSLPRQVVWAVVLLCVLPLVLSLLGADFGNHGAEVEWRTAASLSEGARMNAMHARLSGSFTHTILEWSAVCTAVFVVVLSFVLFRLKGDITTPIIGIALFCAGCMDGFHTLAADRLIEAVADNSDLIPFTWAISRLFNALIIIVGIAVLFVGRARKAQWRVGFVVAVSLAFGGLAYGLIHYCAVSVRLPQTTFPNAIITRPYDVAPLILFAVAGLFLIRKFHRREPGLFSHALLISMIPQVATQAYMAFGSTGLFDNIFNITHFLKIAAYAVPFAGLVLDYTYTARAHKESERLVGLKERWLNSLIETAAMAIVICNRKGEIVVVNLAQSRCLATPARNFSGILSRCCCRKRSATSTSNIGQAILIARRTDSWAKVST